jgi:hypothetical protein
MCPSTLALRFASAASSPTDEYLDLVPSDLRGTFELSGKA